MTDLTRSSTLSEQPSVAEQRAARKALEDCEMVGKPLTGDEARIIGWMLAYAWELVDDLGGRSFEAAIIKQIDHIRDAMREGNAPEALQNLSAGMATAAAYAVANAKWAAMEAVHVGAVDLENERLRDIIRGFIGIADDFDLEGDIIDQARALAALPHQNGETG